MKPVTHWNFIINNLLFFALLFSIVLLINFPVIHFDMIYSEQPSIYIANSAVHSFKDFFTIYLDPQMLNIYNIPFFRPSGHFLIYQLLVPIFGWHNNQAFIIVNLFFLSASCFILFKLYRELFPNYFFGAFIAISFYLMHPVLSLSRFITLHIEFAHICFSALSILYFIRFCKSDYQTSRYLLFSILFFMIAVTFKEPAIAMGGVLIAYLLLQSKFHFTKQIKQISLLLLLVTFSLAIYLSLQWPTMKHPLSFGITTERITTSASIFFRYLLALPHSLAIRKPLVGPDFFWRDVIHTYLSQTIIWLSFGILASTTCFLFFKKRASKAVLSSFIFLLVATFILLTLPIAWAMGMPWHLGLPLLTLSLLVGFSIEYFFDFVGLRKQYSNYLLIFFSCLITISTFFVNQSNVRHINNMSGFTLSLSKNAILHPPLAKVASNDIIVIENRHAMNSFLLSNSFYPEMIEQKYDYVLASVLQRRSMIKFSSIYGGTLFRFAYLSPSIREEIAPFNLNNMNKLSDISIYVWSANFNHIHCFSYDDQANWIDHSTTFKANLLAQIKRRKLTFHHYQMIKNSTLITPTFTELSLSVPDPTLCQFKCDQDKSCRAFTYMHTLRKTLPYIACRLHTQSPSAHHDLAPDGDLFVKSRLKSIG